VKEVGEQKQLDFEPSTVEQQTEELVTTGGDAK
jgi:hypothetical protein